MLSYPPLQDRDKQMLEMKQVTIIGTGLLGASLALALRAKGFTGRIVGVGRRVEVLEQARGLGCFDDLTVSTAEALGSARDLPGGGKHVAVLAAPLGHFEEIFRKIAPCDDPDLIVTDVGSTKSSVCQLAKELLPEPARFVGSHPMAGSEQQGPMAADTNLFIGKPCVLTPEKHTDPDAQDLVEAMWRFIGMRVILMDPAQHDKSVALISHLPHAVAVLLVKVAVADGDSPMQVASTGFADTTRIAAGDPDVWLDIFQTNREAVLDSVKRLEEELSRFHKALARSDHGALLRLLKGAKEVRDNWEAGRRGGR
jgi:prephenate dehydrogenase